MFSDPHLLASAGAPAHAGAPGACDDIDCSDIAYLLSCVTDNDAPGMHISMNVDLNNVQAGNILGQDAFAEAGGLGGGEDGVMPAPPPYSSIPLPPVPLPMPPMAGQEQNVVGGLSMADFDVIGIDHPYGGRGSGVKPAKQRQQSVNKTQQRFPVLCHNPPFRNTKCAGTLEDGSIENLQGVGGNHIGFKCHKCGSRWAQLVFVPADGDKDNPRYAACHKLSRSERAAKGAAVRSGGYDCGICKKPLVKRGDNPDFCDCRCQICYYKPKKCKCKKLLSKIDSATEFFSLPPLTVRTASVPHMPSTEQLRMTGGGTELALKAAEDAVAKARVVMTTPVVAKAPVAAAKAPVAARPVVSSKVIVAKPTVQPPSLPKSVVPGSDRHIYGGKGTTFMRELAEDAEPCVAKKLLEKADEYDLKASMRADETARGGILEPIISDNAMQASQLDAKADDVESVSPEASVEKCLPTPLPEPENPRSGPHSLPKRRKIMKPAHGSARGLVLIRKCQCCDKTGCKIRCRKQGCEVFACSSRCAGYYDADAMRSVGGFVCAAHGDAEDKEEDKAWFCGMCDAMITDRIEPRIPSIGCDKCDTWFCRACVGFGPKQRLPKKWYCSECF
jgi:hypothetical protein